MFLAALTSVVSHDFTVALVLNTQDELFVLHIYGCVVIQYICGMLHAPVHAYGSQKKICVIPLYLISLRKGLSLSLGLSWQPAPPSNLHICTLHNTGVKGVSTGFLHK